jgi:hypothetical protein
MFSLDGPVLHFIGLSNACEGETLKILKKLQLLSVEEKVSTILFRVLTYIPVIGVLYGLTSAYLASKSIRVLQNLCSQSEQFVLSEGQKQLEEAETEVPDEVVSAVDNLIIQNQVTLARSVFIILGLGIVFAPLDIGVTIARMVRDYLNAKKSSV